LTNLRVFDSQIYRAGRNCDDGAPIQGLALSLRRRLKEPIVAGAAWIIFVETVRCVGDTGRSEMDCKVEIMSLVEWVFLSSVVVATITGP